MDQTEDMESLALAAWPRVASDRERADVFGLSENGSYRWPATED
jgi:hypothetical protein